MSIRVCLVFVGALSFVVGAHAQAPSQAKAALPPDINPITLSRLPPPTPADFDEEGKKLLAARPDFKAGPGPTHVTIYAPRERNLGIPSGANSPITPRFFQLAALIGARECDQQYEWSAHEPAGLRQGLDKPKRFLVEARGEQTRASRKGQSGTTPGDAVLVGHAQHQAAQALQGAVGRRNRIAHDGRSLRQVRL